jgi:maltooligosyltrehalose trehalohydrolase
MEHRVWAPAAARVDVVVGERRVPMTRDDDGWWSADAPDGDYAFSLDGADPLPDPRSAHQPNGVHAASRLVDHDGFAWSGVRPRVDLATAVLYELHIGTFSTEGTFDGALAHLDHLVDLGVTAVEVMPIAEFPGARNWGYDGVDLFAPHHAYGGPDGFKRFVDGCHQHGLGVVLDCVYNHLGPEGCYVDRFAPYHTDFFSTPWGAAMNYDRAGSDEVRRFVVDNAAMWFREYRVDGLRLDAVPNIIDVSAVHVLEEVAKLPGFLIGETDANDPRYFEIGLDATWNDDLHHALHVALTGERFGYYADYDGLPDLAHVLMHGWLPRRFSPYRGRTHGRTFPGTGSQLVAYAQNHDQIGNRAVGDRLTPQQLKVASAIVLTSPFVPLLFMGEEWGATTPFQYFTSHTDPALAAAVTEGRRKEFDLDDEAIPDPQDVATFERSKLRWEERLDGEHAELLAWYRDLIALRRSTPELLDGDLSAVDATVEGSRITIRRGPITVVADLSSLDVEVTAA